MKGLHFEKRVENRLRANFPDSKILHDVSIPGRKGKPTQIDFVMLDATGVYVIEAKCYSGKVTGSASDVWWTKETKERDGSTMRKPAMNPLKQNENHVKHLKKLIKDKSIPVYSIIVISGKCDFSAIRLPEKTDKTFMFHLKDFVRGIMETKERAESKLSDSETLGLSELLKQ